MRSSADDPLDAALEAAVRVVREAIAACGAPLPTVAIDGRSGAGKSSLADRLVAAWPLTPAPDLLRLDDVYPGWNGMDLAVEAVHEHVLRARASGEVGVWTAWDWELDRPAEQHILASNAALVIEGCGILTPATAPFIDVSVWVDAPAPLRRARALERDGAGFVPFWEIWAEQEDDHILRDHPRSLADVVIDLP